MALEVEINGKVAGLQADLQKAEGLVSGFARKADAALKHGLAGAGAGLKSLVSGAVGLAAQGAKAGLAAVLAASLALPTGMALGTKAALDLGGGLTDLSARTGQSISDLMAMRTAFDDAGAGADAVGPAVNRLQKALAGVNEDGEPTNAAFEKLGLNVAELKGMSAPEQFDKIGAALRGIGDPAERSAAAMELFGKSGGEMLALFNDPDAFGNASKSVGRQAQILQANAGIFDQVSDLLGHAAMKMQGFFVGVASKVAPVLLPILQRLDGLDFAAWGEQIGNIVALVVQAFGDGSLGTILVQAMQLAGIELLNGMLKAVNALWEGLKQYYGSSIYLLATGLAQLANPAFWSGMGMWFLGLAARFGAAILRGLGPAISYLQAGVEYALQRILLGPQADKRIATAEGMDRDIRTAQSRVDEQSTQLRDVHGRVAANVLPDGRKMLGYSDQQHANDLAEIDRLKNNINGDRKLISTLINQRAKIGDVRSFDQMLADNQSGPTEFANKNVDEMDAAGAALQDQAAPDAKRLLGDAMGAVADQGKLLGEKMVEGWNNAPKPLDSTDQKNSLSALVASLQSNVDAAQAKAAQTAGFTPFEGAGGGAAGKSADGSGGPVGPAAVSSLARIGGGGNVGGANTASLHKEGNKSLRDLVRSTGELLKHVAKIPTTTGGLKYA